jgi:succinate-semialdehyde dehydrogenase/glutarate-semialdehyde dehydrogenase
LSSQKAADDIKEQIRQAVAHGATATEVGPKVPTKAPSCSRPSSPA